MNGKVYCEGVVAGTDGNEEYLVHCCDLAQDVWITLPQLPVREFSLGQVNNQLVAVGGLKKSQSVMATNKVYTYDERSKEWKQTIPPMPTARHSPGVLSLQSALVVAGGDPGLFHTDVVEVFRPETSQWYRTDPLPTKCRCMSLIAADNICYVLGGFKSPTILNQVVYASVDDLLYNAVPANQNTHSGGSSDTQSAWKTLPNTPTFLYGQVAATLADNLLTIGGEESGEGEGNKREIYMYCPTSNQWMHISDLSVPRSRATVAILSPAEVLVIGGFGDDNMKAVYRGTLSMQL